MFSKKKLGKIKELNSRKSALDQMNQEILALEKLMCSSDSPHPNIIRLFEVIEDDAHDSVVLCLEHADLGEALTWDPDRKQFIHHRGVGRFSDDTESKNWAVSKLEVKQIIRDLAQAVLHCMCAHVG